MEKFLTMKNPVYQICQILKWWERPPLLSRMTKFHPEIRNIQQQHPFLFVSSACRKFYLKLKECFQFSLKFNPGPESWILNFTFAPSRALPLAYVTPSCSALIMSTHWKLMSGIPRLMKIIRHGATLANTAETRYSVFSITGLGVCKDCKAKKKLRCSSVLMTWVPKFEHRYCDE